MQLTEAHDVVDLTLGRSPVPSLAVQWGAR